MCIPADSNHKIGRGVNRSVIFETETHSRLMQGQVLQGKRVCESVSRVVRLPFVRPNHEIFAPTAQLLEDLQHPHPTKTRTLIVALSPCCKKDRRRVFRTVRRPQHLEFRVVGHLRVERVREQRICICVTYLCAIYEYSCMCHIYVFNI